MYLKMFVRFAVMLVFALYLWLCVNVCVRKEEEWSTKEIISSLILWFYLFAYFFPVAVIFSLLNPQLTSVNSF